MNWRHYRWARGGKTKGNTRWRVPAVKLQLSWMSAAVISIEITRDNVVEFCASCVLFEEFKIMTMF